jgi:2-polyprenyl-3-methyl-5-hydroxy-6-metoxy-1,4-benzoquinol methylase
MEINPNDYININRKAWNERARIHISSEFYAHQKFMAGQNSLKEIELDMLGDLNHKSLLHLQCHFGQDTLSLARMGAKVTGVDFSDAAIEMAKQTAAQLQLDAKFICCDLYDLPHHLHETFDIVFTSYGTIGWLPDIEKWASVVAKMMKPEAEFIFVEFHPVVWMFDDDIQQIKYNYFKEEAIVENIDGTYADKSVAVKLETISWNHALSEVMQSLLNNGLELLSFKEYDYSPYDVFPNSIQIQEGRFQLKQFGNKMPMVYSLKMKKKG